MKTTLVKRATRGALLFGMLVCCWLFAGCQSQHRITGDEKSVVMRYENGALPKWQYINDHDDIKSIVEDRLGHLNLDLLKYSFTVETTVIHTRFLAKRKLAGFSALKITIPAELSQCLAKNDLAQCKELTESSWFQKTFGVIDTQYVQVIDSTRFFVAERSLGLKDIVAIGARWDALYLLTLYAPKKDFDEGYGEILRSILVRTSFDQAEIKGAYGEGEAGFFGGLWHGAIWLLRWIYSWIEYYDVWPDRNTGFGYVCGFIVGLILASIITNASSKGE